MKLSMERANRIVRDFLARERAKSIHITTAEREELERLGYNPNECRLIERAEGGNVFICVPKIYGPIVISETEEENAAPALAVQGRQEETEFVKKLHQEIKNQLKAIRSSQESR